jgi:hypothetical protein
MRHPRLALTSFVAAALAITATLAPVSLFAQGQPQGQGHPPAPVIGPYKPVPIKLPAAMNDPSFDAFRKHLAEVAQKKDRAALAKIVAHNFFWIPEDKDLAEKGKPAIENLAKALGLNDKDGFGWEALSAYAGEATTSPDPQHKGVFCAPAEPVFDEKAADELANATHTDAADWAFPVRDGVEVRAEAKQDAPVLDKLGLHLVRVLADDSPANAVAAMFVKVVTPSGKVGFAVAETILPVGGEQLCYVKDGGAWKIAGFFGGEPNP